MLTSYAVGGAFGFPNIFKKILKVFADNMKMLDNVQKLVRCLVQFRLLSKKGKTLEVFGRSF